MYLENEYDIKVINNVAIKVFIIGSLGIKYKHTSKGIIQPPTLIATTFLSKIGILKKKRKNSGTKKFCSLKTGYSLIGILTVEKR
jgi:hypothetical protein